jgi:hypothetical protein
MVSITVVHVFSDSPTTNCNEFSENQYHLFHTVQCNLLVCDIFTITETERT